METITLARGAPQTEPELAPAPVGMELPTSAPAEHLQGAISVVGAAALDAPSFAPLAKEAHRYGYRADSPPEMVALLQQAQAGNAEAFGELYRENATRVTRYVAARMRDENRDAIPDVVQDAFCEAFADLPNAHHDVTGWLLVHAAKAYIRYVRSDRQQGRAVRSAREIVRREYAYGHEWVPRAAGSVTAIGHLMLVHALARLTPDQRQVIQHRYLEGQHQTTTAAILGKHLKAAKSAEYRALANLRTALAAPSEVIRNTPLGVQSTGDPLT